MMLLKEIKLLVIDDNEDDRFLYRRNLKKAEREDYKILEAEDGEKGLELVEEGDFSCVLLDYSLPGRNGIEILKKIRLAKPFLPVVMLTGQGNEDIAVQAIREGAQNYISKGNISQETLQRAIRLAIEHAEMNKYIYEQRMSLELFARALAHDLKEPVRTIKSFLEILCTKDLDDEKRNKYFSYVSAAADRMAALIDSVYVLLQSDKRPAEGASAMCDSNEALFEAKQNLSILIAERKAQILSKPLPFVAIEKAQLMRVFQNLISNAIQNTETDPVIEINFEEKENNCIFYIKDNGPGISEEDIKRIFEPFKRIKNKGQENLGLGLSICRKIIESAGGEVTCKSSVGAGAVFALTVPLSLCSFPRENFETSFIQKQEKSLECEMASLLLVEDNEADIELMRYALFEEQNLLCRFDVAHNGLEALHRIEEGESPDVILMDINMPRLDGFEATSKIRALPEGGKIPIIICSTSAYAEDVEKSKEIGANGYIYKPLIYERFKEEIENKTSLHFLEKNEGILLCRQFMESAL